jgi:glycerol-1-phosphate dehydrogenase [NAD(P)+]
MKAQLPVYIGSDAIPELIRYCRAQKFDRFTLVADENTYAALGQRLENALTQGGFAVKTIVLTGREVIPDEHYVVQVLLEAPIDGRPYLAVGSGTLTDIVRFASHRTRTGFISVPTAASVDGFTSIGAPMVIGRWKQTVQTQPPLAVFADEMTLRAAPRLMIASGFGDMMGKYTALADWELGAILWDEPYDVAIDQRARRALNSCMANAEQIGRAEAAGICSQMEGLIETGLCMVEAGNSRPAGGSEHHLSHYWEMTLLKEGRPAILHGAKVGVATTLVARRYEKIRHMTRDEVSVRLAATPLPDREREIALLQNVFGAVAGQSILEQAPFLDMTAESFGQLKAKIVERWQDIQAIAATVPAPADLVELLRTVGGPADTRALGLNENEVAMAEKYAHYLRNRFTVMKLAYILGL